MVVILLIALLIWRNAIAGGPEEHLLAPQAIAVVRGGVRRSGGSIHTHARPDRFAKASAGGEQKGSNIRRTSRYRPLFLHGPE